MFLYLALTDEIETQEWNVSMRFAKKVHQILKWILLIAKYAMYSHLMQLKTITVLCRIE